MPCWRHFVGTTLIILFLCMLAGCWDRQELEERVSVVAIAIDKTEETADGTQDKYTVTVQIPIPIKIVGGGGGEGGGEGGMDTVQVMSATGFSFHHALINLQKRLNQELFLGHVRVILISEEVAREGVQDIIDSLRRDQQIRRLLWLAITKNKAADGLMIKTSIEQIPADYLRAMFENSSRHGTMPGYSIGDFYIALSSPILDPVTFYTETGETDIALNGLALFKKDKMVGSINEEATWRLMHLLNLGPGGQILIGDKNNNGRHLIIEPHSVKTKTKLLTKETPIKAHYKVRLEVDIVENSTQYNLHYPKNIDIVSKLIARQLEQEAKQMIHQLQQYGVDALQLGLKLKAHHYDLWKKMNWDREFPQVKIDVTYDVKIRRTGMSGKTRIQMPME